MAQKRKTEITVRDENDKELLSIFRNTAGDLSKLYSLSINQQKLAYDAGQRHAFEKLNEWIALKMQEGKLVTVAEITAYLQNELNNSAPSSQLHGRWGGGSRQSGASPNRRTELGLSSSTPFMHRQVAGMNVIGSQDLEMEIASEDPIR